MATGKEIVDHSGSVRARRENFALSGPTHLKVIDWANPNHRRSIAASLVQSVYILEHDREQNRVGDQALAPPWWKFFHFDLYKLLIDGSFIFGAIFQFTPKSLDVQFSPRYVIAFRGTITNGYAFTRDLELDIRIILNELHQTKRYEAGIQAVRHVTAIFGSSNIWLAGHSLGAAIAMLAGKNMAKTGVLLEAFLFNPPFLSLPIGRIKDSKVKHDIRYAGSVIKARLALAMKNTNHSGGTFVALTEWLPCLFVHPNDHISSEYIGYFKHRKRMEEMGKGEIGRLATQYWIGGFLLNALGKPLEEALHLIPSAMLNVNRKQATNFKDAHGICQWWRPDLQLESNYYKCG